MTEIYFFDSWGGLWMVCPFDHPRAEAFGPSGAACRMSLENLGIDSVPNITPWRQMFDAGRVETEDGWDFLTTAKPTLTIPWGGPASRARWGLPRFEAPEPGQADRLTFLGVIHFGPCPERRGEVWLCHDRAELAIMLGHIAPVVGGDAPRADNLRALPCALALSRFTGDFEFSGWRSDRVPRVAWRQATALYRAYLNREGSDKGSTGDYGDTWEYTYPQ